MAGGGGGQGTRGVTGRPTGLPAEGGRRDPGVPGGCRGTLSSRGSCRALLRRGAGPPAALPPARRMRGHGETGGPGSLPAGQGHGRAGHGAGRGRGCAHRSGRALGPAAAAHSMAAAIFPPPHDDAPRRRRQRRRRREGVTRTPPPTPRHPLPATGPARRAELGQTVSRAGEPAPPGGGRQRCGARPGTPRPP